MTITGPLDHLGTRTVQRVDHDGTFANQAATLNAPGLLRDPRSHPVVIIVLDDVGPEWFSFYTSGRYASIATPRAYTPNLADMAANGLVFDNAFAAPVCSPTRGMIQTGLYPHHDKLGTTTAANDVPTYRLDDNLIWLPEAIQNGRGQGVYFRIAVGKWHMCTPVAFPAAGFNDGHPRDNGWARFIGAMINAGSNTPNGDYDHFIWSKVTNSGSTNPSRTQIGSTSDYVAIGAAVAPGNASYETDTNWNAGANARDFISAVNAQSKPFLGYVCFNPPHAPFQVPPFAYLTGTTITALTTAGLVQGFKVDPTNKAHCRLVTRANLEAVDYWIGYIRANNLRDADTTYIVIGDNGTDGVLVDETEDAPLKIDHAKRTVFEQGCRVPMLVFGPHVGSPGRRCSHLVQAVDIFPTVLEMTRTKFAFTGIDAIDGKSFFPAVRSPSASAARTRVWQHSFRPNGVYPSDSIDLDQWSLRDARYNYIRIEANDNVTESFYDLQVDPWQATDLSGALGATELAAMDRLRDEAEAIIES